MTTLSEPLTLTPHWGDRARDAYWDNPGKAHMLALFFVGAAVMAAAVALF